MSFDLCQVRVAEKPYYIENIGKHIYSIEELCFYLYRNIYLIDETIVNEVLCDWIRDELGLRRLYSQMYEHLEKKDGIASFITPIFREIGYLPADKLREYQENLSRLDVQPGDTRQKLKGDYLVRCGMYSNAISEYYHVLERQNPGNLGARFYSEIWNNLGCAYARLFQFSDAADCFRKAWKMSGTKEMLRKYVSVLPLFLSDEDYKARVSELNADPVLIGNIQEYNLKAASNAKAREEEMKDKPDPEAALQALKDEYRRGAGV